MKRTTPAILKKRVGGYPIGSPVLLRGKTDVDSETWRVIDKPFRTLHQRYVWIDPMKEMFDSLGNVTEEALHYLLQTVCGLTADEAAHHLQHKSRDVILANLAAVCFMKGDSQSTEAQVIGRACRKHLPQLCGGGEK